MDGVQRDIKLFVLNKIERAMNTSDKQDSRNSLLASVSAINTVLAGFDENGTYVSRYIGTDTSPTAVLSSQGAYAYDGGSKKTHVVYHGKTRKVHTMRDKKFIKCDGKNVNLSEIRGKYKYV